MTRRVSDSGLTINYRDSKAKSYVNGRKPVRDVFVGSVMVKPRSAHAQEQYDKRSMKIRQEADECLRQWREQKLMKQRLNIK